MKIVKILSLAKLYNYFTKKEVMNMNMPLKSIKT